MQFSAIDYKNDCKKFRGDLPCRPHKDHGYHCSDCPEYRRSAGKILIIKLGAIGDVIRTTPLLVPLQNEYPNHEIWWLTQYPDVVPNSVDKVLQFSAESVLVAQSTAFDLVISLDKDHFAIALASQLRTKNIFGFTMVDGKCAPANEAARDKFITGLFDDANKANRKSYLEEIFEICGYKFHGEEYILNNSFAKDWGIDPKGKPIVGLNTGCGDRWTSRLWSEEYWLKLCQLLSDGGYFPLLLGGRQEHEKNTRLASAGSATYLGHFPLQEFVSLMDNCNTVVTAVTMGLHLAIGLRKKVVLINNIFNPKEFELYGRGEIIMPTKECTCYFSPKCKRTDYFCLDSLTPEMVFDAVRRQAGN